MFHDEDIAVAMYRRGGSQEREKERLCFGLFYY
jgi:hypothetical protein